MADAWRNAYTPTAVVVSHPRLAFDTHEYGYCEGGKGPWAWGASNVTVEQCTAQAVALKATCFDYMCPYHEAANCTCASQRSGFGCNI